MTLRLLPVDFPKFSHTPRSAEQEADDELAVDRLVNDALARGGPEIAVCLLTVAISQLADLTEAPADVRHHAAEFLYGECTPVDRRRIHALFRLFESARPS